MCAMILCLVLLATTAKGERLEEDSLGNEVGNLSAFSFNDKDLVADSTETAGYPADCDASKYFMSTPYQQKLISNTEDFADMVKKCKAQYMDAGKFGGWVQRYSSGEGWCARFTQAPTQAEWNKAQKSNCKGYPGKSGHCGAVCGTSFNKATAPYTVNMGVTTCPSGYTQLKGDQAECVAACKYFQGTGMLSGISFGGATSRNCKRDVGYWPGVKGASWTRKAFCIVLYNTSSSRPSHFNMYSTNKRKDATWTYGQVCASPPEPPTPVPPTPTPPTPVPPPPECSSHTAFRGGRKWKGQCFTWEECKAHCTGDCVGVNWWPVNGGCRTHHGKFKKKTTKHTTYSGLKKDGSLDCEPSTKGPTSKKLCGKKAVKP